MNKIINQKINIKKTLFQIILSCVKLRIKTSHDTSQKKPKACLASLMPKLPTHSTKGYGVKFFVYDLRSPISNSGKISFPFFLLLLFLFVFCFVLRQCLTLAHIGYNSLLSLGYPQTHNNDPVSLFLVWGLHVCTTTGCKMPFHWQWAILCPNALNVSIFKLHLGSQPWWLTLVTLDLRRLKQEVG